MKYKCTAYSHAHSYHNTHRPARASQANVPGNLYCTNYHSYPRARTHVNIHTSLFDNIISISISILINTCCLVYCVFFIYAILDFDNVGIIP